MKIDNPIVSGSLIVSGSTTITGYLSASTFVGDGSGLVGVTSYTDSDTLSYINTLGVVSSSAQLSTEISGAFISTSSSLSSRISVLEEFSSSLDATFATDSELSTVSSSLASNISNNDSRLTTLEGKTLISSSIQLSNQTIPGDLTVGGILTAQEFHTEFVSASIIYDSGSTQFGNSLDDIHNFSGSLAVNTDNLFVSGGNVGIGTTSPTFATIGTYNQRGLHIAGTVVNGTAPVIRLSELGSLKGNFEIRSNRVAGTSGNTLQFGEGEDIFMVIRGDDNDGGVTSRGFVGIGTTSPSAKLDVVGQVRASTGILFGSDTAAANTLDDYEEGTFTATLKGLTDPTTPVTTTGRYIKIGNQVTITIPFTNANTTGASGYVAIIGLPFTSSNSTQTFGSVSCYYFNFNSGTSISSYLSTSSTTLYFLTSASNTTWSDLYHNPGTSRFLWTTHTYFV